MEIEIKGQLGSKAKIGMRILPINGVTIIQGIAPNGKIFKPSISFKEVGAFPCKVDFHFILHRRPWSIELIFEGGITFSTSNKTIGLDDTDIITPDIIKFIINYSIPEQ